jgi:hypothetical protein
MTFVFICDSYFQKKKGLIGLSALIKGEIPNHNIITITADEFLQTGKFPNDVSGVLIERGTWQKNFSLFRYFGLLPMFESQKLAFVANSSEAELKGRLGMKGRETVISRNLGAEEISTQLTNMLELPLPAFTHPTSKAVA